MRYNRLGNSGLVVSELCLGAMTFGNKPSKFFQHELDQDGATALVRQALDGGINFIDTANVYTQGQSEEFVGGAIRALGIPRQEIVIATKGMGPMGPGPNDAGTGRKHLLHHVDESLKRLGLDHVDLYQIHGWDPLTPMEEALRGARRHRPLGPRALCRRVELGRVADRQGARDRGAARVGQARLAAGLLHRRLARSRARTRADAAPAKGSA